MPGCGVPPPPDSRRFSNNSQITNDTNCNDCDNNNNNNIIIIININNNHNYNDTVNKIGSLSAQRDDIEYDTSNSAVARGQQKKTPGGCLEHHGAGCLTAETARPTPLPPQKPRERPFTEFTGIWTISKNSGSRFDLLKISQDLISLKNPVVFRPSWSVVEV